MLPLRARKWLGRAVGEVAGASERPEALFLPEALKSPINYAAPRIPDVNDLGGSEKGDHSLVRFTWK